MLTQFVLLADRRNALSKQVETLCATVAAAQAKIQADPNDKQALAAFGAAAKELTAATEAYVKLVPSPGDEAAERLPIHNRDILIGLARKVQEAIGYDQLKDRLAGSMDKAAAISNKEELVDFGRDLGALCNNVGMLAGNIPRQEISSLSRFGSLLILPDTK
jgi:hypothetical protein